MDFAGGFLPGVSVEDVLEAIRCGCDELGGVTGTGRPGVVTSEVVVVVGGGAQGAAGSILRLLDRLDAPVFASSVIAPSSTTGGAPDAPAP